MINKEIYDLILAWADKYTAIKGSFEIKDSKVVPFKEEDYWVFSGTGDHKDILDAFDEFEGIEDGFYTFGALLRWDKGQKGEYGRYEIPPLFEIEHIELERLKDDVAPDNGGFYWIHETDF
jgi:hypothetical protein